MESMDFLEKMDLIEPDMVEHASYIPRRRHVRWTYYASMAACLAVVVACGALFINAQSTGDANIQVSDGVASFISSTPMLWLLVGIIALVAAVGLGVCIAKKRRSGGEA